MQHTDPPPPVIHGTDRHLATGLSLRDAHNISIMPAARHLPRTRFLLLAYRFAVLFNIVGFIGAALSIYDLTRGRDALVALIVCAGLSAVGVTGWRMTTKRLKTGVTRDWAALPADIRRDLPYGAQEHGDRIEFPTKISMVVILLLLGTGTCALAAYGYFTEDTGGAAIAVVFGSIAILVFGCAALIHGVAWSVDDHGVTRHLWPQSTIAWSSIAEYHTDHRNVVLTLTGPNRSRPRVTFMCVLLEVSQPDLIATLQRFQPRRTGPPKTGQPGSDRS